MEKSEKVRKEKDRFIHPSRLVYDPSSVRRQTSLTTLAGMARKIPAGFPTFHFCVSKMLKESWKGESFYIPDTSIRICAKIYVITKDKKEK